MRFLESLDFCPEVLEDPNKRNIVLIAASVLIAGISSTILAGTYAVTHISDIVIANLDPNTCVVIIKHICEK